MSSLSAKSIHVHLQMKLKKKKKKTFQIAYAIYAMIMTQIRKKHGHVVAQILIAVPFMKDAIPTKRKSILRSID